MQERRSKLNCKKGKFSLPFPIQRFVYCQQGSFGINVPAATDFRTASTGAMPTSAKTRSMLARASSRGNVWERSPGPADALI